MDAEGVHMGAVDGGYTTRESNGSENGSRPVAGLVFQVLTIAAGLALIVVPNIEYHLRRYSVAAGVCRSARAYGMSTYVPSALTCTLHPRFRNGRRRPGR